MVGALILLKMLHCRQIRQRKKKMKHCSIEDIKPDHTSSGEASSQTCRVCLKEGTIPIFGSEVSDDFSEAIATFGGIELHAEDEYPKYLCQSCYDLLQSAILLRKTAQQSDHRLRQPSVLTIKDDECNDSDNHVIENDDHIVSDSPCEFQVEVNVTQDDLYNCKRCDLEFDSFQSYADHRISSEHENMRHVCHICKKSYTRLYYKRHMTLHKAEKTYICDICGKEFIVRGQFTRHRLTHFNDLPFKCSLCPYRGRFTESLKMHMRTHTGEKPYQCSACPSKFVNKSNLNKHMLTHKADYDFKCEACGRGFYTKKSLEQHYKVDHTGVKEHVCNICGKAFGYRKQMMKHQLKVHKREKFRSGRLPLYLQVDSKDNTD